MVFYKTLELHTYYEFISYYYFSLTSKFPRLKYIQCISTKNHWNKNVESHLMIYSAISSFKNTYGRTQEEPIKQKCVESRVLFEKRKS